MKGKKILAFIISIVSITTLLCGCGNSKNIASVPEESVTEISEESQSNNQQDDDLDNAESTDKENVSAESEKSSAVKETSNQSNTKKSSNAKELNGTEKSPDNKNITSSKNTNTQAKTQTKTVEQSKIAQSSNASKSTNADSNKIVEAKEDTNTVAKAKEENESKQIGSLVYKSNLGFIMTFPESWKGKYTVTEDGGEVRVSFKSSDPANSVNSGWMFSIIKKGSGVDTDFLDSIDGRRSITVGGKEYIVGGPTGLTVNPECSDFNQFQTMRGQMGSVLDSVRSY